MFLFSPSLAISSLFIDISRRTPVFFPASRWRLPDPPPQMHPSAPDAPFPSSPPPRSSRGVCLLPSLHTPGGWQDVVVVAPTCDDGADADARGIRGTSQVRHGQGERGKHEAEDEGKDATWRKVEVQAADGGADERMARESRPRPGAGRRRMRPTWRRFPGEETPGTEGEDAWSCELKRCVHTRRKTQER